MSAILTFIRDLTGKEGKPSTDGWIRFPCPLHDDRKWSAAVHPEFEIFRCFAEDCPQYGTWGVENLVPRVRESGLSAVYRGVRATEGSRRASARASYTPDSQRPSDGALAAYAEIQPLRRYIVVFLQKHPKSDQLDGIDFDLLEEAGLRAMAEKYTAGYRPELGTLLLGARPRRAPDGVEGSYFFVSTRSSISHAWSSACHAERRTKYLGDQRGALRRPISGA